MLIDAGASLNLFIGQPTSKYNNEIEIDIDVGEAKFITFDEASLLLTV